MRRADVVRVLAQHKVELDGFGIRSLSVFGSVARDEAHDASDLDLLVEYAEPVTFDRYFGLLLFLEDLFGVGVDLVIPETLRPRIRPAVLAEAVRVA
jgi:predicted nucleotidyltransferase